MGTRCIRLKIVRRLENPYDTEVARVGDRVL